jgi:hypothetical protein
LVLKFLLRNSISTSFLAFSISAYANKLTQAEIENARKEVEIELRNKNFKTKNF